MPKCPNTKMPKWQNVKMTNNPPPRLRDGVTRAVALPSFTTVVHYRRLLPSLITTVIYYRRFVTVRILLSVCQTVLKGTPQNRRRRSRGQRLVRGRWTKKCILFEPPFLSIVSRFRLPFWLPFGACFLICVSFFRASNSHWFFIDFWSLSGTTDHVKKRF